jgi:carboxypeptidase PM20D1
MKKILLTFGVVLVVLAGIMGIKTSIFVADKVKDLGERRAFLRDTMAALHLQQAVNFPSVASEDDSLSGLGAIDSLVEFLTFTYPEVFTATEWQIIGGHSLLMRWKGSGNQAPVLFYAHMDVVPIEENSQHAWRFKPFGESHKNDTIFGRGTIDDKAGVIGILEAASRLIKKGHQPKRDIYLAFGHDEETGGKNGAARLAGHLEKNGIKVEWLLDEGGMIAENMVPFVKPPVALIMTAEKGFMSVELTAEGNGGHSSFPPKETPMDIMIAGLDRLHESPFERRAIPALEGFMDHTGPEMKFPFNMLFANRWLFRPVILSEYEKIPEANAMIRTTMACTIMKGGVKDNVLPSHVSATLNFRILPGETSSDILEALKQKLADDRISIRVKVRSDEPSLVSSTESNGFKEISESVRAVFPDVIVAPSLSIAATDSRHFSKVAKDIYRFLPVRMNRDLLSGMHGANERISVDAFTETVQFYSTLLEKQ